MFRRGLLFFIGLSLVVPAGPARAQEHDPADDRAKLAEGVRVRLTSPPLGLFGDTGTVNLSGRGGMVVVLDDGERVSVPYPALVGLEVSRGERRATAQGALAGAAFGALVALAAGEPTYEEWRESGDDGLNLGNITLGAMVGGAFGVVIGSAITYESWRPVPWMRLMGPDRDFGGGLILETRFDAGR